MLNFLETTVPQQDLLSPIIMIVLMVAVFYFMLIRPENKRKKEAENLRNAVKTGDSITTIGGIVGIIVDVKEDRVVIETGADRVRMEIMKWGISTNESAAERAKEEEKKAKEAKNKEKAEKEKAKAEKKGEK